MLLEYNKPMQKIWKVVKWVLLVLFVLVFSAAIVIQTGFFKSFITRQVTSFVKNKIKTEFRLGKVDYSIPNWIELNDLYIEDESGKVLAKGKKIKVNLNMLGLLTGKYEINNILLDSIQLNLTRKPFDSLYNFQFINNAFATKESARLKDTIAAKPFNILLKKIELKNAIVTIEDNYSGLHLNATIVAFTGLADKLDLEKYTFSFKEANLQQSDIKIRMLTATAPLSVAVEPVINPSFTLQKAVVIKSAIYFEDSALQMISNNRIDSFEVNNLDYAVDKINISAIRLQNSKIQFSHNTALIKSKILADTITTKVIENNLRVAVGSLLLSQNNIQYKDAGKPAAAEGFNLANFELNKLAANIKNILYSSKGTAATIENIALQEEKGFQLDSLSGIISVSDDTYKLDKLLIKTPNSYIQGNALVLPATFSTNPTLNNLINISNTSISLKDVALINPAIVKKYQQQIGNNKTLFINLTAKGNARQFTIQSLSAHTNSNDIQLRASGTLGNLDNLKKLLYDITIQDMVASKSFLQPFVKVADTDVRLPPVIRLKGTISGSTTRANPNVAISSAYGIALINGTVTGFDNQQNLTYNFRLAAKQLETGKWINKDSLLGKLTGYLTIKGRGTDYKKATAISNINFSSFVVKQHEYNNILVHAKASNGLYQVDGNINDDALLMNLKTDLAFTNNYPSAKGFMDIGHADFNAMGFIPDTVSIKTSVKFDIADLNPATLKALIQLDSSSFTIGTKKYLLDSMQATAARDSGLTTFMFVSPMADAHLSGAFTYNQLPALAKFYQEKYFISQRKTSIDSIANSSIDMNLIVKPHPMLLLLLPGLFFDKNIIVTAKTINQNDSSMLLNAAAPLLVYNGNRMAGFTATAAGFKDSIKYAVNIDSASSGAIQLFTTNLSGRYSNNRLSADLVTKNENGKDKYAVGISGTKNKDSYLLSLSDKLLINYNNWQVNKNNQISLSTNGFNIQQLDINKQAEKIAIQSISAAENAAVNININEFALANITGILNQDSLMVDGKLNVALTIADFDKKVPTASGKIAIDSLKYQQIPVGNIVLNAKTIDNSGVAIDAALTGYQNKVSVAATYNQQKIDGNILLEPITLQTVQAFSKGYLTESNGGITGKLAITGTVNHPELNGNLQFNNAVARLTGYGTQLRIDKQQIIISYPQIRLQQFTIKDSLNQPITIDGTLTQVEGMDFKTNLTVKTTNFTALDNTASANNTIYGKAIVDADVEITGLASAPEISGAVALKEKSVITVVRQQQVPGEKDRKGVIEFVDMDTIRNALPVDKLTVPVAKQKRGGILQYNLNIDISKDAKLSVIVDPLTRDELMVEGSAQLNAGVQPNGDIAITGAYNLSKGSYQLNYQFIKRKFELQEGSTILFSGDPLNAAADITAIYEINAIPFDLIGNELGSTSNLDASLYKQKLPFEVVLIIKGPILEPQLNFNIRLKEKVAGVSADLATTIDNKLLQLRGDASQMNKEVFGLLIMGRFIGEQSKDFFASSGSGGGLQPQQVVKESVSRFLSDAVNQLAADLIKGLDINVNLKTVDDYSTATQRTDLSVALSKRLLNDRLTISVGKDFTIEGDDPLARGQNNNNLKFLPDVSTSYKLSKDGKYAMRLYRRNQYEAIMDGYFTETGVAFTFSVNYDRFKELFNKKSDK